MRTRLQRTLLVVAAALVVGAVAAACGSEAPSTAAGSSTAAAQATSSAAPTAEVTVLEQQPEIPGEAAATETAAPVDGTPKSTTPTGRMKYGESMGYALPQTRNWETALEVRVTDLAATDGAPAGTFELSVANRTGAPFDLADLQVRAVDAAGATVAELTNSADTAKAFAVLASPAVMQLRFTLPVDAGAVEIWAQPSPTATEITAWSTNGG